MTLKENFINTLHNWIEKDYDREHVAELLEIDSIDYANQVAIGFYKWMGEEDTEDLIYSLRNKGEIYYDPTYEELLEIFKKEKGL